MAGHIFIVFPAYFVYVFFIDFAVGNGLYIHWHMHIHLTRDAVAEPVYPFACRAVLRDPLRPLLVCWFIAWQGKARVYAFSW